MATLIEQLADFSAGLKLEDLPGNVLAEAKRIILDSAACGVAGFVSEKGKLAASAAKQMGSGEATVLGIGQKASVYGAAFANGELMNALDYDALLTPPGHAAPYVLPALLALAERSRLPGEQLLLATVVSHEACVRIGAAMGYYRDPANPRTTLHPVTGFSSAVLGAAFGAGKLLSLGPSETANAVGLAGRLAPAQSNTKWVRTVPLTMDKSLMAGGASQIPITSALLASTGYTGDTSVLEGDYGFWRFMGSAKWNPAGILDGLGKKWNFVPATIYKYYPGCRIIHTALDCFVAILEQEKLQPEEIESVYAYVDAHIAEEPAWANIDLKSDIDAQMSVAYSFGVAAYRVPAGPGWFAPETWRDERIQKFMPRVKFAGHPDYFKALEKDPASRIGKVEVLARGRKFAGERNYRKGSPATPETYMSDRDLEEKFSRCASGLLPARKVESACRQVWELEKLGDVSELMENLAV